MDSDAVSELSGYASFPIDDTDDDYRSIAVELIQGLMVRHAEVVVTTNSCDYDLVVPLASISVCCFAVNRAEWLGAFGRLMYGYWLLARGY